MTSAFRIDGCERMAGTVSNNCSAVPPRGAGGGMPGACTEYRLLEDLDGAARRTDRPPVPETIGGHARELPQHAHLTVREGDVFVITNGGGGGLGDPLLRDPGAVADDVAAELVTAAAAAGLYGVVLDAGGRPDGSATSELRRAIRRERIGAEPARAPLPTLDIEVGIGVRAGPDQWSCGYCAADLGPLSSNYREACVVRARDAAQALGELGLRVRPLRDCARVLLIEHCCPACASLVRVDLAPAGTPPILAPELARPKPAG